MGDSPKVNPNPGYGADETTPLVRAADVLPCGERKYGKDASPLCKPIRASHPPTAAPPAYWAVGQQRQDVGQQAQLGQHVLPQQPGPSVVPGHSNPGTLMVGTVNHAGTCMNALPLTVSCSTLLIPGCPAHLCLSPALLPCSPQPPALCCNHHGDLRYS